MAEKKPKANRTVAVIYGERLTKLPNAKAEREELWVSAADLEAAGGWRLKPEGFCKGEVCVPVPPGKRAALIRDNEYNLTALAKMLGQPVVHDDEHAVWCIGEAAAQRRRALTSLDAPDFTLPDLDGAVHSLSQHRGKKVLLVSWASW